MVRAPKPKNAWIQSIVEGLARTPSKGHWHPTIKGFGMRVSPKGKAVWICRFRGPDGKEVPDGTLGNVAHATDGFGNFTLQDAIKEFDKRKEEAFRVPEPPPPPAPPRPEVLTFKQAFERWLVEHRKKKGRGKILPVTAEYYTTCVNSYLAPAHDWVLIEASTKNWLQLLTTVQARSTSRAKALMYMVGNLYAHFIDLDEAVVNPIEKAIMKDTFAAEDTKVVTKTSVKVMDIPLFYAAVQGLRRQSREAIMLLFLTGWRRSAVLRMRWEDVNLREGSYEVKRGYAGWKGLVGVIALGGYVVALLEERYAHLKAKGQLGEYVFPARYAKGTKRIPKVPYMASVRDALDDVVQPMLGYKVKPHDLRRTFITVGDIVTGNLRIVGQLVGHRQLGFEDGKKSDSGTRQTTEYLTEMLAREQKAAFEIEEVLLEVGGFMSVSPETEKLLRKASIDPTNLHLVEIPDDDEEEVSEEGEAAVAA
jgi:integrase